MLRIHGRQGLFKSNGIATQDELAAQELWYRQIMNSEVQYLDIVTRSSGEVRGSPVVSGPSAADDGNGDFWGGTWWDYQ